MTDRDPVAGTRHQNSHCSTWRFATLVSCCCSIVFDDGRQSSPYASFARDVQRDRRTDAADNGLLEGYCPRRGMYAPISKQGDNMGEG